MSTRLESFAPTALVHAATAACFGALLHFADPPRVRIDTGTLDGLDTAGWSVFRGIPYAAPPVGNLRWKPPQPAAKWSGVRNATEFGFHCMQGKVYGEPKYPDPSPSEDCLTLNVWVPLQHDSQKLPVMVWIHGGGFAAGAGS